MSWQRMGHPLFVEDQDLKYLECATANQSSRTATIDLLRGFCLHWNPRLCGPHLCRRQLDRRANPTLYRCRIQRLHCASRRNPDRLHDSLRHYAARPRLPERALGPRLAAASPAAWPCAGHCRMRSLPLARRTVYVSFCNWILCRWNDRRLAGLDWRPRPIVPAPSLRRTLHGHRLLRPGSQRRSRWAARQIRELAHRLPALCRRRILHLPSSAPPARR